MPNPRPTREEVGLSDLLIAGLTMAAGLFALVALMCIAVGVAYLAYIQ
jgi:hypothetical protein